MEEPEKVKDAADLKKLIYEKGRPWLVAAMVEGSIGYHTPRHAEVIIDRVLEGAVKDWCERCDACFGSDVYEMINYDIRCMTFLEERDPEKAVRLIKTVEAISTMSTEGQLSVSLAYPTMCI